MSLPPRLKLVVTFITLLAGSSVSAQEGDSRLASHGCPVADGCQVASGDYRIIMPSGAKAERPGAIMYFHGYQGSAVETVADVGLVAVANRLGVALIAPDGSGRSWSFPGSPARHRDELPFVGLVLDDAVARFRLDPSRILASGFSQGGSMVWYLACRMPQRFAAFAPIAGAFWEPWPERCDDPRPPLIHVHGTSDATVPLAGRALRSGAQQADVFKSFSILAPGGCTAAWAETARAASEGEGLACRIASAAAARPDWSFACMPVATRPIRPG